MILPPFPLWAVWSGWTWFLLLLHHTPHLAPDFPTPPSACLPHSFPFTPILPPPWDPRGQWQGFAPTPTPPAYHHPHHHTCHPSLIASRDRTTWDPTPLPCPHLPPYPLQGLLPADLPLLWWRLPTQLGLPAGGQELLPARPRQRGLPTLPTQANLCWKTCYASPLPFA